MKLTISAPLRQRLHLYFVVSLLLAIMSCGGLLAFQLWQEKVVSSSPLPGDAAATPCAIWFVGSSSFAYWNDMAEDMSPWPVVNRGIGGANITYILHRWQFEKRAAKPAAIIIYAGENDIDSGLAVPNVVSDYSALIAAFARAMPDVPIIAMALKPSPTRIIQRGDQIKFNNSINKLTSVYRNFNYLDANSGLVAKGQLGPFYLQDGIHLNAAGHRLWAERLKEELARDISDRTGHCTSGSAI